MIKFLMTMFVSPASQNFDQVSNIKPFCKINAGGPPEWYKDQYFKCVEFLDQKRPDWRVNCGFRGVPWWEKPQNTI